ncbi:MAG: TonB-dependent receptor, partial [Blastocatellia bacterium]|nr:TonB-dependent receptor [Blastocatellia bacterium]
YVDQDWPSKIGLQNVDQTTFPTLNFSGTAEQGGGIGAGGRLGSGNAGGTYNGSTIVMDDLTIVRGSHNFKTGFELRKYYYNIRNRSGSGNFNFSPVQTGLPGFADSTGHSFASFLLGAVSSSSRGIAVANFGYRVAQPGFYFMDDWKITQKLTLNLGLRWEIIGGFNEVAGRESGIDLNKPNPGAGDLPGALVFTDEMGRKSFQDPYYYMISPRVGFAYAVSKKLVVRGGYGINNTPFIANFNTPGDFGFNGSIAVNSTTRTLPYPQAPVMYLQDPFPSFNGALPNRDPALANNQGIGYIAPDSNRVAYVQNYNLGFQYLLPASLVLEVSYIGNKGTRLSSYGLDNLNQLPVSALGYGDALIESLSDNPGLVPLPYAGFSGTVAQALRPYPQYDSIGQVFPNFGTSNYNSLQVQLTRHLSRGLAIMAAYTWSKAIMVGSDSAIDSAGAQDVYQRNLERTITSFSMPHVFKLTWVYDLPIGKGRKWNPGKVLGPLIGGWTLTGIHNYRSGDPLSISASGPQTVLFNGTIRPDWIAGVPVILNSDADVKTDGSGRLYLNPAAFAIVPVTGNNVPLRLGTAPPRLPGIFGPGVYSEDFGIRKNFAFTEAAHLEFRVDMFNAFNRAGRGNPQTDLSNAQFGEITGARFGPRNIQFEARIVF